MDDKTYLKQVIVVRKDLSMPTGKLAAMVAHASMTFIIKRLAASYQQAYPDDLATHIHLSDLRFTKDEYRWMTELDPGLEDLGQVSMAKIVCAVDNLTELLAVEMRAERACVDWHRVTDSGHSHNKPGDIVAVAVGPDWPDLLEPVTGGLKVYR